MADEPSVVANAREAEIGRGTAFRGGRRRGERGRGGRGLHSSSPREAGQAEGFRYVRVSDGIVGTCQDIERPYVRVQSQPDPASVRPPEILCQSLHAVACREAAGEPYSDTGEFYMSICQDLRLQEIENDLTVSAREGFALCAMRARVGLPGEEKGMDIKTLSDCFLHLQALYIKNPGQPRQLEFTVYRFLMWLGLTANGVNDTYGQLNTSLRALTFYSPHPAVQHAIKVMSAVVLGDAQGYFALKAWLPSAAQEQCHIHDTLIVPVMRTKIYQVLLKAYKFAIPLRDVGLMLDMSGPELVAWLQQRGAVLNSDALEVDETKKADKQAQPQAV